MAVLNLRDVPDELARELRVEAAQNDKGVREYCVEILASRKKIAEDTPRDGSPESSGDTPLSRGGKAQDTVPMAVDTEIGMTTRELGEAGQKVFGKVSRRDKLKMPEWSAERIKELSEEEPGGLMACSPEILTDMLEAAKTDPATAATLHLAGVKLDRSILARWGLEYIKTGEMSGDKEKAASAGSEKEAATGDDRPYPSAVQENNDGDEGPAVGVGKPEVDMGVLREICKGTLPPHEDDFLVKAKNNISAGRYECTDLGWKLDRKINPVAPMESAVHADIDICGFKTYNDVDGENYMCGLEKHGPKVKHGDWIKI